MTCTGSPAPDSVVLLTKCRGTPVDARLATAVLLDVSLDAALGWWWAGPLTVWRCQVAFGPGGPGGVSGHLHIGRLRPSRRQAVATSQMRGCMLAGSKPATQGGCRGPQRQHRARPD